METFLQVSAFQPVSCSESMATGQCQSNGSHSHYVHIAKGEGDVDAWMSTDFTCGSGLHV